MCHMIYIATDCQDDLSILNDSLAKLSLLADKSKETRAISILSLPHVWHVGLGYGCSCGFRNHDPGLGFSEPEDWFPEKKDEIEATRQAYNIFSKILETGSQLDCLSVWDGGESDDIEIIEISFKEVSEKQFRFFTNYLFKIVK